TPINADKKETAYLRLSAFIGGSLVLSRHESEPVRQFQLLEYPVNVGVDGTQNDLYRLTIGQASQLFHGSDHIRIDPGHGGEIQNHFALLAVHFLNSFLNPHRIGCHTVDHSFAVTFSG